MLDGDDSILRLGYLHYCYLNNPAQTRAMKQQQQQQQSSSRRDDNEVDSPFTRPQVLARLGQFIIDVKVRDIAKTN